MNFSQFFKDNTNALSQTRLVLFAVASAILSVYLSGNISNIITAIMTHTPFTHVDFAANEMIALGIVVTGKVTQTFGEK